jgi:uncharacterized protein (TIGR00725 family)
VGKLLVAKGVIVVTGGKFGIIEFAAGNAKRVNGLTVGVVKEGVRGVSNAYTNVEVHSGSGAGGLDEFLLVTMCDGLIVIDGWAGTLEEIAIAYLCGKTIVDIVNIGGWGDALAGAFLNKRRTVVIDAAISAKGAVNCLLERLEGWFSTT